MLVMVANVLVQYQLFSLGDNFGDPSSPNKDIL